MYIKEILSQHRRDFSAIYECENCENQIEKGGYDDRNFHDNVVPQIKCEKCKKSSLDLGTDTNRRETKYPEGFQI